MNELDKIKELAGIPVNEERYIAPEVECLAGIIDHLNKIRKEIMGMNPDVAKGLDIAMDEIQGKIGEINSGGKMSPVSRRIWSDLTDQERLERLS